MQACDNPCFREVDGQSAYPSPAVRDDEWLCRSARPQDFKATGELKSGFIHAKPLKEGCLSVWRISDPGQFVTVADKMPDGEGYNVLATKAATLRSIKIDDCRAVCVINDTRTTYTGDNDPLHAAVSLCTRFMPINDDEPATVMAFEEARQKILLAFRHGGISMRPIPGR